MYSSAKKLQRVLSSGEIRKTFIDYFISNHGHKFVRSSPVVPFSDPTVAFVNAGMNQFKSVFLGKAQAPYARVANSQKCVRVGGKHNDLSVVGQDNYHHTFFEMLGNWSFGDYFKREACAFALELLRGPYGIDPSRLYVTYFAGDRVLGLPADLECFEIWRSLGFPAERILPFGSSENFWEMGPTGPCGPCTEIHIDHLSERMHTNDGAKFVNAGRPDLTELWNLVFIQYNRHEDGSITALPAHNVDTGMGFERLTAILQQKTSNYDTDLFAPLIDCIQKISKAPAYAGTFPTKWESATLDTGYRILADHARMVTACLSDGMLPDQNQKLRRVMRKAFNVSESIFANEHLLGQLVPVVVDTLGGAYPEMCSKQDAVLELIAHEQDVYKRLRETSAKAFAEVLSDFPNLEDIDLMESPGFVPAYREFRVQCPNFPNKTIPGEFLYKLTDTYGLTEESFHKLAELEHLHCDLAGYRQKVAEAKLRSKAALGNDSTAVQQCTEEALSQLTRTLPATDNSAKYVYSYNEAAKQYSIPSVEARVTGLMLNDKAVSAIARCDLRTDSDTIYVVTDASNFYYEAGGQQSDCGKLRINTATASVDLHVDHALCLNDCVVHVCRVNAGALGEDFKLNAADVVLLSVDAEQRKMNTCHHTATHLLNAVIRQLYHKVTYQVSSAVTSEQCKLELGLIGQRLSKEHVQHIEDLIGRIICAALPTAVRLVSAADVLQQNDITLVPGEVYPETGLRLITMDDGDLGLRSKELCCGTHVHNTREIEYFCITGLRQTNRARYAFTAVAATAAEKVLKSAALIRHRVDVLEEQFKTDRHTNATEVQLQQIRNSILHDNITLPYAFKVDTLDRCNEILKKLKETSRLSLKEFIEVEMKNLLQEKPLATNRFIVHYITSSALMEEVPLQRATKICTDRPILVIGMCDGLVKARCCVPRPYVTNYFNANLWLMEFAAIFNAHVVAPKGKPPGEVCNMKGRRISTQFDEQLELAMRRATDFAEEYLN